MLASPEPQARRARPRVREPRRHRPPDARRLDLDRHPRHRRALAQHLGPGRGGRAGARRRQLARDLGRLRPRRGWRRRGSGSARSGSSTRSRSAPCPPSRSTASTGRGRSTRPSRASTSSTPANDHFEFYVFPHTQTALCRESRRTDEPPRPRPRAAGLRPGGDARELGRRRLRARRPPPARRRFPGSRGSPPPASGARPRSTAAYRVFASRAPDQVHRDGVRDPARARRRGGAPGAAAGGAPGAAVAFPIEVRFVAADDVDPERRPRPRHLLHRRAPGPQARLGALLPRGRGDHGAPTAGARTGASATSRPPRRWRRATRAGTSSRRCGRGSTPRAGSRTSTPRRRPRRLEERLALAAVGRDLVDDPLALDQVERVEALAELAGLRVAQVDAVADPQLVCGGAEDRGLDLAGALLAVEAQPAGQVGLGQAVARRAAPEAR